MTISAGEFAKQLEARAEALLHWGEPTPQLNAAAALIRAQEAEIDGLKRAAADAIAQIACADVQSPRHNPAGHLTDRALWLDRATSTLRAALGGKET